MKTVLTFSQHCAIIRLSKERNEDLKMIKASDLRAKTTLAKEQNYKLMREAVIEFMEKTIQPYLISESEKGCSVCQYPISSLIKIDALQLFLKMMSDEGYAVTVDNADMATIKW